LNTLGANPYGSALGRPLTRVCWLALALALLLTWPPTVLAAPADQSFTVDNPNDGTDDTPPMERATAFPEAAAPPLFYAHIRVWIEKDIDPKTHLDERGLRVYAGTK